VAASYPLASSGCNTNLADALSWLATAEAKLGRVGEAERHHVAAFRAVEEAGLAEQSHRALSLAQFLRVHRDWAKHEATLRDWALALAAASERLRAAEAAQQPPPAAAEGEEAEAEAPAQPAQPAALTGLFAGAAAGAECEVDILHAAVCMLHERVNGFISQGKPGDAALLCVGPLLALCARLDSFGMRPRPGGPPGAASPLPVLQTHAIMDTAASLWSSQPQLVAGQTHPVAIACMHLRIGLLVAALGHGGAAPPDRALWPPDKPGCDQRLLALNGEWRKAAAGGTAVWLPPAVLKAVTACADELIAAGGRWRPAPDAVPVALAFLGKREPSEEQQAAGALAMSLLPFANALMGSRALHAARVAGAGAMLCGQAGMVANQAEALHLMGAALFHAGPEQFLMARAVFAASVAAKRACGADGGPGLSGADKSGEAAKLVPAKTQQEAQASAGFVETLLFLAKMQWETRETGAAEQTHTAAFQFARTRLGDEHPVTKKAIATLMDVKRKLQAIQAGAAQAAEAKAKAEAPKAAPAAPVGSTGEAKAAKAKKAKSEELD